MANLNHVARFRCDAAENTVSGRLDLDDRLVGWHPYHKALAMAAAYRSAIQDIKTEEQREMINSLTVWLEGFVPWAQVAASLGRPVPDLVGFWAS